MKLRAHITLGALLLALAIGGCVGGGETRLDEDQMPQHSFGSESGSQREQITVTDVAGREVTLTVPLESVALQGSGSGGPFITMLVLEGEDLPDRLAGWDPGLKENRDWEWQKISEVIPAMRKVPNIGSIGDDSFDIEHVMSLEPDALIITKMIYEGNRETVERLEELGIPVVAIDYHEQSLQNHLASITILGDLFGKEERAAELAEFYEGHVQGVLSRVGDIPEAEWPRVYIEVGHEGPQTFSNSYDDQLWGAMVKQTGGDNIAAGAVKQAGGSPLEAEFILQKDPEVIVITGSHWPGFEDSMRLGYEATEEDSLERLRAFLERPGWSHLAAVENDQVYSIHHILSREVWDVASYEFLAKAFHPSEFDDTNPEETLREFHERFLPYDYSGTFMLGPVGR